MSKNNLRSDVAAIAASIEKLKRTMQRQQAALEVTEAQIELFEELLSSASTAKPTAK